MADSLVSTRRVFEGAGNAAPARLSLSLAASPAAIEAEWRELELRAPVSAYQRYDFLKAWLDQAAAGEGVVACLGVVRNESGRIAAILPFGFTARWGLKIASYLGGDHVNLNMPLIDPAFGRTLDRDGAEALLHDYCLAAGVDVLLLANQPATWSGAEHAFAQLGAQPSPDVLLRIEAESDYEAYATAQVSKDSRSKLRRKAKKLEEAGVALLEARGEADVERLLQAFLAQKARRLQAMGADNPFAEPGIAAFLRQAALTGAVEFFGLVVEERVLAVTGWLRRGEEASLMILSFDAEDELARNSPGEVLLTRLMAAGLGRSLKRLDFGLGTERYKTTWSNSETAMFDTIFAVTMRGVLYAQFLRLRLGLTRAIKRNAPLYARLKKLRARLVGRRSGDNE